MHRARITAALAVMFLLVLSACSGKTGDDKGSASATTTQPGGKPTLTWTVDGIEANGTQPPSDATMAAVKTTLDEYLAVAVVGPLHSGAAAGDLTSVLAPAAVERVAADPAARATLVDEGMPAATKSIAAEAATATLSSVAGPDGVTALVAARLDLRLRAIGPLVDVKIARTGEVVLAPEGDKWMIESFVLRTQRDTTP